MTDADDNGLSFAKAGAAWAVAAANLILANTCAGPTADVTKVSGNAERIPRGYGREYRAVAGR